MKILLLKKLPIGLGKKMFNNKQKAIIVFSMLGEVFSDNILKKLPEDVFHKVQEEVFPYVGKIPFPDDIDAFVLENIINDDDVLDLNEDEEEVSEAVFDILELQGDEFLEKVDDSIIVNLLMKEKSLFQSFILHFFSADKRKLLEEELEKQGVKIVKEFRKTAVLESVEANVKKEFIEKLKFQIKFDNKG